VSFIINNFLFDKIRVNFNFSNSKIKNIKVRLINEYIISLINKNPKIIATNFHKLSNLHILIYFFSILFENDENTIKKYKYKYQVRKKHM
jgi:hypothetical protein